MDEIIKTLVRQLSSKDMDDLELEAKVYVLLDLADKIPDRVERNAMVTAAFVTILRSRKGA